ncbi:hypothetical protein ACLB2K_068243 [Fragaria x ananassa]
MIFVDGLPFASDSSSEPQKLNHGCLYLIKTFVCHEQQQGWDTLQALLDHPSLESASNALKAIPEKKFSVSQDSVPESRWVYLFQREYATVDPAFVNTDFPFTDIKNVSSQSSAKFAGTDEATTCMGLAIRNPENGMTSVAHLDSPKVVDMGLSQMMSLLVQDNMDVELDHGNCNTRSENQAKLDGYSFPLGAKIIETLLKRPERFHIRTLCILRHNTRRDPEGNAYPIFHGFMISTSTGSIIPASFDETSRCPDEIVRRIRVSASYEDSRWKGRLLETYETQTDLFKIAPCCW